MIAYIVICVVVWLVLVLMAEKFCRYLDETEYPECPTYIEDGKEYYGY